MRAWDRVGAAWRRVRPPVRVVPTALPPAVALDLDGTALAYARSRLEHHGHDTYGGLGIRKFPEDLRVYEHLLWDARCNVVIELGTSQGGSTLWFRDRLEAMARYGRIRRPLVVAIDLIASTTEEYVRWADPDARHITFLEADLLDPELPKRVEALLRPGDRAFVIEDSAHEFDTTMASLVGFADFVPADGYFVVEDTVVDIERLRVHPPWPRGVQPALEQWLATEQGKRFEVDRALELYGLTCHPGGFLRRRGSTR